MGAVTVQLAQSLKTEGFTLIAMHPGARPDPVTATTHAALRRRDGTSPLLSAVNAGQLGREATSARSPHSFQQWAGANAS